MRLWSCDENDFVIDNINKMGNRELGFLLNRSPMGIKNCMLRNSISRSLDFQKMLAKNRPPLCGENNPCWKGGISQNHYHYKLIQIKRYPKRINARKLSHNAIRSGKLIKEPCEICGTAENIQSHHEDYSKPLDVKWLCRKHHRELHDNEYGKIRWFDRKAEARHLKERKKLTLINKEA